MNPASMPVSETTLPRRSAQVVALTLANGVNFLVNFLMTPYLARKLSLHDNGTIGQVYLINGYVTLICSLGLGSIVSLMLAEAQKRESKVFAHFTFLQLLSTLIGALVIFLVSFQADTLFNNEQLGYFLQLYLPSTIVLLITSTFSYYLVFFHRTKTLSRITVISNLIRVLFIYIAVNVTKSVPQILIFMNIVNILTAVLQFCYLPKDLVKWEKIDYGYIKSILNLGFPYLLLGLLGYGIVYFDGIMISSMLNTEEFAVYRNGAIEIPFIATIYNSISAVLMPAIAKLNYENNVDEILSLKRKLNSMVACVTYPVVIFLIINSDIFIVTYLGQKYTASALVFAIYNISVLIRINDYQDLLVIKKKPKEIIYCNVFVFALNIVINYFAIKSFGVYGSAAAYSFSIFLLAAVLVIRTLALYKRPISSYMNFSVLGALVLLSTGLSLSSKYFIKGSFFAFILIFSVYCSIVYFIILRYFKVIDISYFPRKLRPLLSKISRR